MKFTKNIPEEISVRLLSYAKCLLAKNSVKNDKNYSRFRARLKTPEDYRQEFLLVLKPEEIVDYLYYISQALGIEIYTWIIRKSPDINPENVNHFLSNSEVYKYYVAILDLAYSLGLSSEIDKFDVVNRMSNSDKVQKFLDDLDNIQDEQVAEFRFNSVHFMSLLKQRPEMRLHVYSEL